MRGNGPFGRDEAKGRAAPMARGTRWPARRRGQKQQRVCVGGPSSPLTCRDHRARKDDAGAPWLSAPEIGWPDAPFKTTQRTPFQMGRRVSPVSLGYMQGVSGLTLHPV